MKYKDKDYMKEQAIQLYIEGKNYIEIAKIIGCSRNYISNLIKNDIKIKEKQNTKVLKVYKNPNKGKKNLTIGIDLLSKIGINKDNTSIDYVQVSLDEKNKSLIIKKYDI